MGIIVGQYFQLNDKIRILRIQPIGLFLGVGIGVVDIGYERQLANHLGAHSTPSILGLINGKVTFFHYSVVREHLKQFVESLLPQKLVEKVGVSLIILMMR